MKALLFYAHVASNWGDLAINSGVAELLKKSGLQTRDIRFVRLRPSDAFARQSSLLTPEIPTVDAPLTEVPKGGRDEIELLIEYVGNPMQFALDFEIDRQSLVLVNSGEHLFEASAEPNTIDLIWRVLPLLAARAVGARSIILPSTLGPFRTALGTEIVNVFDSGVDAAAFRDTESRRLTGASNGKPVLLDPGFFAAGLERVPSREDVNGHLGLVFRLEDYGLRAGSGRSAFVQAKYRSSGYADSHSFRVFRAVARRALRAGDSVSIIIQTRADREISAALYDALSAEFPDESLALHDPESFDDYLALLRSVGQLVTSRFHAMILAWGQGVPAVGVYSETHGHKMPGLASLLGDSRLAVRADDRLYSNVSRSVQTALNRSRDAESNVLLRIEQLRRETVEWLSAAVASGNALGKYDYSEFRVQALSKIARVAYQAAERRDIEEIKASLRALAG